jgi:peptidoglycan/xylan/chitin deacetylase (PgdA/CDA1 family)
MAAAMSEPRFRAILMPTLNSWDVFEVFSVIRSLAPLALLLIAAAQLAPAAADESCPKPETALGVSRIVEIAATSGPLFGEFSKYEREPRFLGPKEVVLTFDDGPMPRYTKPSLDALDTFCTKATFFSVGRMAMAYPDMVKEVMARGHTMGTHTWSHPMNLRRQGIAVAKDQIERGFAAVALAADTPIAPFFRFPGLSDSGPMLAYLQERGIAAFTVDVVSNDSYIGNSDRLIKRTLEQIEKQDGGIVLFHDIKASTAKALPTILAELKKRGYKVVHLRSKTTFEPLPALTAELGAQRAKIAANEGTKPKLVPFYAAITPVTLDATTGEPEVTELAPTPRERTHPGGTHATADDPIATDGNAAPAPRRARKRRAHRKGTVSGEYNGSIPSLSKAVSGNY